MLAPSLKCNSIVLLLAIFFLSSVKLEAIEESNEYTNGVENHQCLKCHGQGFYEFYNDWTETNVRKLMPKEHYIDTLNFYKSSHWDFKCTDCHTEDYNDFPHNGELRMEYINSCIDCHGDDEDWAHFNFETIEEGFNTSVHSPEKLPNFGCWECHNSHSYKLDYRNTSNLLLTIERNNQTCIQCHSQENKMSLFSDSLFKNLNETHDWLPNQEAHFNKVRCLECHAEQNEQLMVSHKILPASESVKNCVECHSENSLLLSSLYKYQSIENRKKYGFYNATILNESYVIGASRNQYLSLFSFFTFAITILLILLHAIILFISKKKNHGK